MRCGRCAWDNQTGVAFCTNCGHRLGGDDSSRSTPSAPGEADRSAVVRRAEDIGLSATVITPSTPGSAPHTPDAAAPQASTPPASASPVAVRVCTICGTENQPSMNFCRQCGSGLSASQTANPVPAVSSEPSYQSRQQDASDPADARLIMLLKDGSEGRTIELHEPCLDLGSSDGDISFEDDAYLSPRHARIERLPNGYRLTDLDSVNGIYVRIRAATPLQDGDMVLLGQQVLRFERLGEAERSFGPGHQRGVMVFGTPDVLRHARLLRYSAEGLSRDTYYLFRDETILGRENGDIVFTDDPFLSRKHAAIRVDPSAQQFTLHDLGSSNGTAVRVRGSVLLRSGDEFRMGRHLFRFETRADGAPG